MSLLTCPQTLLRVCKRKWQIFVSYFFDFRDTLIPDSSISGISTFIFFFLFFVSSFPYASRPFVNNYGAHTLGDESRFFRLKTLDSRSTVIRGSGTFLHFCLLNIIQTSKMWTLVRFQEIGDDEETADFFISVVRLFKFFLRFLQILFLDLTTMDPFHLMNKSKFSIPSKLSQVFCRFIFFFLPILSVNKLLKKNYGFSSFSVKSLSMYVTWKKKFKIRDF